MSTTVAAAGGREYLLVVSAGSAVALDRATAETAARLRRLQTESFPDAAYTLAVARKARPYRVAVVSRDAQQAAQALEQLSAGAGCDGAPSTGQPLVFVLPADIPDAERLAAEAARVHPGFARHHAACRRAGALDHGHAGAVFAFAYATVRLWMRWGLSPRTVYATGMGRLAAEAAAESLTLGRAVALLDSPHGVPDSGEGRRRRARFTVEPLESEMDFPDDPLVLRPDTGTPLEALRKAWLAGAEVDWTAVYEGERRRRVRLPALNRAPGAVESGQQADATETTATAVADEPEWPWSLSAPTAAALAQQATELADLVERAPAWFSQGPSGLPDAVRTAAQPGHPHRAVVLGRRPQDFLRGLTAVASGRPDAGVVRGTTSVTDGRVVFVYPGHGSQWQGMAADLFDSSPAFREEAERCAEAFAPHLDWSLTDVLRDRPGAASLDRVDVAQPALFTVMASLTALWRSWGVHPDAVIGHSIGDMVAGYVSGALSLQDAALVSARASRIQQTIAGMGAMASVELPAEAVRERLAAYGGRVELAAVNGPDWVLVSGDRDEVLRFVEDVQSDGASARVAGVPLAAHSAHVDRITDRMMHELACVAAGPTTIPLRSSVTGALLRGTELGAAHWCRSLRDRVEFESAVRAQVEDGYRVFVEVSPHPVLVMGVNGVLEAAGVDAEAVAVGSLRRGQRSRRTLLAMLSELYVRGAAVEGAEPFGRSRRAGTADTVDSDGDAAPEDEVEAAAPRRAAAADGSSAATERELLELVGAHVAALLGADAPETVDPDWAARSLGALGFTSALAVELRDRLARDTGLRLPRTLVFDHPEPRGLSRHLADEQRRRAGEAPVPERAAETSGTGTNTDAGTGTDRDAFAVIGMAAHLPGAGDLDEYWNLLTGGREAIARLSDEELAAANVHASLIHDPRYVKAYGALSGGELFDAPFFGMTPAEAELTDPQHRLFLQTCHAALEHAGYDAARPPGAVGVFGGAAPNTYFHNNVLGATDRTSTSQSFSVTFANDKDYLATRVAYKLNLTGASYTVQTACSTSLVAVHLACQALRGGELDLVLAGGVALRAPQAQGHLYEQGTILSADGHIRAFDADASGTVFGNGAGVVVLKRLSDAVRDGDTVHAVVLGTATNNDGAQKVSYAAPSGHGQAEVIARAQAAAGVGARAISYVEAHGTGTRLGDPVEVDALTRAFRRTTDATGYCAIGTVKPNIGHLDAAAGVAGLIKVALMLRHRTIVPSINYERPNPAIEFGESPFRVATRLRSWTVEEGPLRAGISSFGVGGTNAHAVLEQAPEREPSGPSRPEQLLLLSAATPFALDHVTARLAAHLRLDPDVPLADVAHTLAVGRTAHRHRRALLCRDTDDAVRLLEDTSGHGEHTRRAGLTPPAVVLALPGIDTTDPDALATTAVRWAEERAFAEAYEACTAAGALRLGAPGRAFALQYALAGLWQDWGLLPETYYAEGVGELVAGCLTGRHSLGQALAALERGTRSEPGPRVLPYGDLGTAHAGVVLTADGRTSPQAALREAWLAGAEVDWTAFYRGERRHRVPLPTYPFEGRRYWLEPVASAAPSAPEVQPEPAPVPVPVPVPARQEIVLSGDETYLADHVVHGVHVLPAAVHLELARAAGESATGARTGSLRNVGFNRKLSFRGDPRTVRITLEPRDTAVLRFTVTADGGSAAEPGEPAYATGEFVPDGTPPSPERVDLDEAGERCPTRLAPDACYALLRRRGLLHGPSLRALRGLAHRAGEEAVAEIEVPASAETSLAAGGFAGPGTLLLHPALLDGALQAAVCLLAASDEADGSGYLPMGIGELRLLADPGRRCAVRVTRSERGARRDQVAHLDLELVKEDGTVAVRVTDLVLRRVPAASPPPPQPEPATAFLRAHWTPALLPVDADDIGTGPVLLLAEADACREALGRELRDRGDRDTPVVLALPGTGFRRVDRHTYEVDAARPSSLADLLTALDADGIAPGRILHAWSLTADASDAFGAGRLDTGIGSLFHLTKALLARRPVRPVRLLYLHPLDAGGEAVPAYAAVAAFARTARLENPALAYRAAGVAADALATQLPLLVREFGAGTGREPEIRYVAGIRLARRDRAVATPAGAGPAESPLRERGVYLITGGTGGLGLLLAEHLAARVRARLVLVSRSAPDGSARERIEALTASGATVRHLRADVGREEDVRGIVSAVTAEHGTLHGVIHAAGVLRDSFLVGKTAQELETVLAPKVHGTVHLDRLTAGHPLDFFVTFSSAVASSGNVGQADYAYANAFLDHAMTVRERLVADGRRSGRSLSIGWPLWQAGGMRPDDTSAALLEKTLGSAALPTPVGLAAFETALTLRGGAVRVAHTDSGTAPTTPAPAPAPAPEAVEAHVVTEPATPSTAEPDLRAVARDLLRALLAAQTKLDPAGIDADTPLDSYGIDSLLIVKLNSALEESFGELSKTLFFEYTTLDELADHFVAEHADRLRELAPAAQPAPAPVTEAAPAPVTEADAAPAQPQVSLLRDGRLAHDTCPEDAVAIIGLSGRYPQAADLDAFWQNLVEGRDCVTEVPAERWEHGRYFQEGEPAPGRAYTKWGAFLDGVDRFDPLFFGIAPREAELMDPQERLFLQTAWHAVEDAGYRPADLAGRSVAVFVGAMYAEYQLYGAERVLRGEGPVPASLHASIANRVSYVLNLTGPSMAVDTMCSSSLTALHLACRSLGDGESELALAGGVNLSLHPHKYVYLSQGRFASSDGRCRSFGDGGTGYVPGEGVGAVLLKPLRRALADGDHIHGVIVGHAVNHGGRTNGYTVPNPNAQQRVVEQALRQAGVSPRDLGCVEAHGTGTSLGDPIEITGLRKAFEAVERDAAHRKGDGPDTQYCPIGSLKSNIGHLEAAAGIAGLTKVLLQMRHGRLVPSLHSEHPNPNIDFARSPFRVQRAGADWPAPADAPRRAALSSFGAGGSNAHVVVSEAPATTPAADRAAVAQRTARPLLYVLSARDEERLRVHAGRLARFLHTAHVDLGDVAHTLLWGREPMAERLAVVTDEGAALAAALTAFAEGAAVPAGLWHGRAGARQGTFAPDTDPLTQAGRWVAGADPEGSPVAPPAGARTPRRVPLPGYPFAEERYWLGDALTARPATAPGAAFLHPLLHANESTLTETRFRTTLRRDDALLADHEVAGRRLLAGTALLEMTRAAVERAAGRAPGRLRDVVWGRPVEVVAATLDVYVALRAEGGADTTDSGAAVAFEVYSRTDDGGRVTHVRGTAVTTAPAPAGPPRDIEGTRRRCGVTRSAAETYDDYRRAGFDYGPSFQVTREVRIGTDEVLVEAQLSEQELSQGDFVLPPTLLDGLLRSVHWMNRHTAPSADDLVVPFSLGEIDILRPLPPVCLAHAVPAAGGGARATAVQRFDVVITDENGTEAVRIRDFAGRVLGTTPATSASPAGEPLFYEFGWEPRALPPTATGPDGRVADTLLALTPDPEQVRQLARTGGWSRVVQVSFGDRYGTDGADAYVLDPAAPDHFRRLLADVTGHGARPAPDVVHLWDLAAPGPTDEYALPDAAFTTGLFPLLYLLHAARDGGHDTLRVLYAHTGRPEQETLIGLARAAEGGRPRLWFRAVRHDAPAPSAGELARTVAAEFVAGPARRTAELRRDADGRRLERVARRAASVPATGAGAVPLRERGVYLITGGGGGIGLVFARHLAERYRARLVLMNRRPLADAARAEVDRLTALGADVLTVRGDVADADDVRRALAETRQRFGRLDGVFHAAGTFDPTPVHDADRTRFETVLAAKTHGTVHLDVLTRDEPLDLFVLFSSVSGALGDFGAGSYAAANRFLDAYAGTRAQWVREGRRHGRTLSLAWPLWAVGGVDSALDPGEVERYRAATGMRPLTADEGIELFEQAWTHEAPLLLPAVADAAAADRALGIDDTGARESAVPEPDPRPAGEPAPVVGALRSRVVEHVRSRLAGVLRLAPARLDGRTELDSYGLDSVMVMEANTLLGRDFPGLPGTLFFEYRTVEEVADFLIREHSGTVARRFGEHEPREAEGPVVTGPGQPPAPVPAASPAPRRASVTARVTPSPAGHGLRPTADEPIAIIGMSGRYPKARDLDEFWENLRAGRDCVTEVPTDRWDSDALFDPDPRAAGRSYSRWGGFLDDVDAFDSLFFRLSPAQAKVMDPQERLFLETAWSALEDAGYPLDALPRPRFGAEGRDVGVFVGVMWGDYAVLAAEESFRGNPVTVLANRSSIANHVSYFGDFRGPSLVVDTACSSSLVALHLACESIRRGECGLAIAGGVNVAVHPDKYVHLSRMTMLAKDGRCRSFGDGGSGYVPGEGVGAVLLKRLSQAEADGDRIHAVIRSTVVNHGGRTSGLTVPNPRAQQALIEEALHRAGVDARTIGCVEAHGTGTALGDPIEHTGLERAFRTHTEDQGFCALGSVKSVIGHLEGAAGIAGLTKAVLQLRHGQLVPSLHARDLNPVIDFTASPFRVQRELADWRAPADGPRRAAVSSFGAGGANAHVVVEEYVAAGAEDRPADPDAGRPELLTLSARTEDRLRAQAARLAAFLRRERDAHRPLALADVAHTLLAGREAMAERLAVTVYGLDEAVDVLEAFARDEAGDRVVRGGAGADAAVSDLLTGIAEGRDLAYALAASGDLDRLGRLWVSGMSLDAAVLQRGRGRTAHRITLPTYPFERRRHWLTPRRDEPAGSAGETGERVRPAVGPARSPGEPGVRRRTLDPADPVLRDHLVRGRSILPGVAHLDLVFSELPRPPRALRDVRWRTPVVVDGTAAELVLSTRQDGEAVRYEIHGGGDVLHSEGLLAEPDSSDGASVSVEAVRERCRAARTGDELYADLAGRGLGYGPYFRIVERLWTGDGEALARLSLPSAHRAPGGRHALHPGMADAALHTIAGLLGPDDGVLMPFSADEVHLLRQVPADGWAHVTALGGHRYDVALLDDTGQVCVRFRDVACRPVPVERGEETDAAHDSFAYRPRWVPAPLPAPLPGRTPTGGRTVLLSAPESARDLALTLGRVHQDLGDEVRHLWRSADDTATPVATGQPVPDLVYFLAGTEEITEHGTAPAAEARAEVVALHRLVRGLPPRGAESRLKVVTVGALPLCEDEPSRPWAAGLWGYCSVLDKEYPALRTAYVDLRGDEAADLAAQVVAEPFAARVRAVSLRGGVRRTLHLEPVDLPAPAESGIRFRDQGVYLILGGLGAIGLDTAHHLARTRRARLVLLGRTAPNARQAARIAEIERVGGEVMHLVCDATDPVALREAVVRAKERFGVLHGVIHSAMVLGATPVRDLDEHALDTALAGKTDTTWNLARAVRDEPLDFLLLYSSGVSFAGNNGQAGYAAGCAFADSLARHLSRTARHPVRILNWGYWHAGGDPEREEILRRLVAAGIRPIGAREGMDTLERFLASGLPQILATRATEPILRALGADPAVRVRSLPTSPLPVTAAVEPPRIDESGRRTDGEQLEDSRALDRLGRVLLLAAWQRAGVLCHAGERRTVAELRGALGVVDRHERLYGVLLELLVSAGFVRRDGDGIVALPVVEEEEARLALADPGAVRGRLPSGRPWTAAVADLLLRCTRELPDVLAGRTDATEVLFPGGSLDAVGAVYRGNAVIDGIGAHLAAVVGRYAAERLAADPGARIRVLEVGAGTGGTTRDVLAALAPYAGRVEYTYTDVSAGFVRHGSQLFADSHPFTDFRVLDIETGPETQGFAPGAFDIVLGTNVFHATRRIHRTVEHVKSLLRPNGLFLASEGTRADHAMTLVFGLTDGWWAFEDPEHRIPGTPLLSAAAWRDVMTDCGFRHAVTHGLPQEGPAVQSLVAAVSDGLVVHRDTAPANGRADTAAPAPPGRRTPSDTAAPASDRYAAAEELVRGVFARVLEMAPDQLDPDATFETYGIDSLVVLQLNTALEEHVGRVPTTLLFEQITIGRLARWLLAERPDAVGDTKPEPGVRVPMPPQEPVAADLEHMIDALSDGQVEELLRALKPTDRGAAPHHAAANGTAVTE
ncbi:SDR family NAD(P)-dependent oxidoreductase [Streptomyces sp900129855]|uniref:SDR family NAD(P)-dependent oxidoreductase n=1 Tax=Streptomyces sp. 900129855 TaxID=3155129 RepID=A0ABV2ZU34_9ACTN